MGRIARKRVADYFERGDLAPTMAERGKALEDLICYVFEKIPGITVSMRNALNAFDTEEVDVAFWNDVHPDGLPFLPRLILVECKNWSQALGTQEVTYFVDKLRSRGLTFGILVAANGITGNPVHRTDAHSAVAGALREQRQLVILTRAEVQQWATHGEIVQLLKEKLCQLAVAGTIFET